jgi:hypothetical protein
MPHDETPSAGVTETDEKMASGTREEIESSEEKATPTQTPNEPPYTGRGSEDERALIFKQDLRIIPLCSGIYLLCYLDRSNIGNAKVRPPLSFQSQNPNLTPIPTGPKPRIRQRPPNRNAHDKLPIHHRPHGLPDRLRPLRSPEQLHAQAPETQQLDRVPDAVLGSHHDGVGRRAELWRRDGCEVLVGGFRGGVVSGVGL